MITRRIRKNTIRLGLSLLLLLPLTASPLPAAAAEEAAQYTLEQAVARALTHNTNLQSAELSREQNELSYIDSQKQFERAMADGYETMGAYESALVNLNNSYTHYQSSERKMETEKESLALSVREAYWKVVQSRAALELAQTNQLLQQRELKKNQLYAQNGALSEFDLSKAKTALDSAVTATAQQNTALDAAYRAFNTLLRLPLTDRPQLVDNADYAPLELVSLDYHITKILESHPQIWELERGVSTSKASANLSYYQGGSDPYRSGQIAIDQAVLSLNKAKTDIAESLRTMYEEIIRTEQNVAVARQSLNTAEQTYNYVQLQYKWGMISELELMNADYNRLKAAADLNSLICVHDTAIIRFIQPWL